jgi:hypothetical protein
LRVSEETNTEIGNLVGYNIRFEDVCTKDTKIKYLTDVNDNLKIGNVSSRNDVRSIINIIFSNNDR